MIKYTLKEVFEILKDKDKFVEKIKVNGIVFYAEQLEKIHKLEKVNKDFWQNIELEIKYYLSRREALIVLLEEDFYNKLVYDITNLTQYEKKASQRFIINNKSKKDLDTPQKVHPKNPCTYFNNDNMGYKKFQYVKAISKIVLTSFYFFEVKTAKDTLAKTYEKMITNDC